MKEMGVFGKTESKIKDNSILNERFENTGYMAMPCNIVQKILDLKNEVVAKLKGYDLEVYNRNKKYFDYVENNREMYTVNSRPEEDYSLGACLAYLMDLSLEEGNISGEGVIIKDVEIYSSEYYLTFDCKYEGVCTIKNGNSDLCEIIALHIFSEEIGTSMLQVVYFDGEHLRTFTPYSGNSVNVLTQTCIGSEMYSHVIGNKSKNSYNKELFTEIYKDYLPNDTGSCEYYEALTTGYLKFLGLEDAEDAVNNFDVAFTEVEKVLSGKM